MSRSPQRRELDQPMPERTKERATLALGDLKALKAVGSFRIVDKADLREGNIQKLIQRGYLVQKTLNHNHKHYEILTTSKKGLDYLIKQASPDDKQRYWAGMVKPREMAHDMAIYRAVEQEKAQIEKSAGRVQRVVLDYEFKSQIAPVMNKPGPKSKAERKKELAEEHELPLVDGKVMLPDARIEYVDAQGQEHHKDIEVVTPAYRGGMKAAKNKSGFSMHNSSDGPRGSVLDDHNRGYL